MTDRNLIAKKARNFFEDLWKSDDPWSLETSQFEKDRYESILTMINDRHYERALEIGCGSGTFTRLLPSFVNEVVALDISATAIERARNAGNSNNAIDYRVANIMEYDVRKEGPWDLVIMSETVYYLGWLYSFFEVGWLAAELLASMNNDGRLVLANTRGKIDDFNDENTLLLPWLIDTYRDLFLNVGYKLEAEKTFHGFKDSYPLEVLISLYRYSK